MDVAGQVRMLCRGRGQVTAAVAANNVIAVVTTRGWFLRYDLAKGSIPGEVSASMVS